MPQQKPPRISIGLTPCLRRAPRHERRQRRAGARLALLGAAALGLSAVLAATHLGLVAQFVGGLALLPLSLAAFLRLLPPIPWTDGGTDGWSRGRGGDGDGPPPDSPPSNPNWDSFERQFRAYADQQQPVRISIE